MATDMGMAYFVVVICYGYRYGYGLLCGCHLLWLQIWVWPTLWLSSAMATDMGMAYFVVVICYGYRYGYGLLCGCHLLWLQIWVWPTLCDQNPMHCCGQQKPYYFRLAREGVGRRGWGILPPVNPSKTNCGWSNCTSWCCGAAKSSVTHATSRLNAQQQ